MKDREICEFRVCIGRDCKRNGSMDLWFFLNGKKLGKEDELPRVKIGETSCLHRCSFGPNVLVKSLVTDDDGKIVEGVHPPRVRKTNKDYQRLLEVVESQLNNS